MKITQALLAEHVVYHHMFDYIEQTLPGMKTLAEVSAVAALLAAMLTIHAEAEDDLLMEPLEPSISQMGQEENIHAEHDQIEEELAKALKARRTARAKAHLLEAVIISRKHFDKEERLVFPLAERVLSTRSQETLGRRWAKKRMVILED